MTTCPHCDADVGDLRTHERDCDENPHAAGGHVCHDCGVRSFNRGGSWTRVERGGEAFWRCPDCQPGVE